MSLASRLGRVAPALSAKQRAMMAIRAYLSDAEPDPEVGRTMPADQRREDDYYIGLLYTANGALCVLCKTHAGMVNALEFDRDHLSILGKAASLLEETCGDEANAKTVRGWRKRTVTVPEFLRGLEDEVRRSLLRQALLYWKELRALEILWAEIAEEVDGEDLRAPDLKETAAESREKLLGLLADLAPKLAKDPPEPDDALLTGLRSHVVEAMRLFGFREEGK